MKKLLLALLFAPLVALAQESPYIIQKSDFIVLKNPTPSGGGAAVQPYSGTPVLGDVIYFDGTNWVSLPIGSDTEVLTITAGIPSWAAGGGGGAPTDATYITQTANGSLSAEQALESLSSGIMRVATTTGVITSLTTSAGIAANISDETGSGALVFGTGPTITNGDVVDTDTVWDAAGDLAVGTGSNTAARLAIGQRGRLLSNVNGALAWRFPPFFEDFYGPYGTTNVGAQNGPSGAWAVVNTGGSGAGCGGPAITAAMSSHPGVFSCDVGTSGAGSSVVTGQNGNGNTFVWGPNKYYEMMLYIPVLSDTGGSQAFQFRAGTSDSTTTADGTDEILIEYTDSVNSGAWVIHTCNNGSCSDTNGSGGAIAAATWYKIGILMNNAANSIEVFQNDVSIGTKATDLPVSETVAARRLSLGYFSIATANATASQEYWCDYVLLDQGTR